MDAKPDYYGLLGVSREATAAEIKAALQRRAAAFHAAGKPKNVDDVEELRRYATAYRVLSDPDLRAYYDRTGHDPEAELAGARQALADLEKPKSFRDVAGGARDGLEIAGLLANLLSGL